MFHLGHAGSLRFMHKTHRLHRCLPQLRTVDQVVAKNCILSFQKHAHVVPCLHTFMGVKKTASEKTPYCACCVGCEYPKEWRAADALVGSLVSLNVNLCLFTHFCFLDRRGWGRGSQGAPVVSAQTQGRPLDRSLLSL